MRPWSAIEEIAQQMYEIYNRRKEQTKRVKAAINMAKRVRKLKAQKLKEQVERNLKKVKEAKEKLNELKSNRVEEWLINQSNTETSNNNSNNSKSITNKSSNKKTTSALSNTQRENNNTTKSTQIKNEVLSDNNNQLSLPYYSLDPHEDLVIYNPAYLQSNYYAVNAVNKAKEAISEYDRLEEEYQDILNRFPELNSDI